MFWSESCSSRFGVFDDLKSCYTRVYSYNLVSSKVSFHSSISSLSFALAFQAILVPLYATQFSFGLSFAIKFLTRTSAPS